MKKKKFDEDIILSDFDSEHDDHKEEELVGIEGEIEEFEQKSTYSEVEEPNSVVVAECSGQRDEVEGENERFKVKEADTPLICPGKWCKETDLVQIKDASVLSLTRKLQGRQFSSEWYRIQPWLVLCESCLKAF